MAKKTLRYFLLYLVCLGTPSALVATSAPLTDDVTIESADVQSGDSDCVSRDLNHEVTSRIPPPLEKYQQYEKEHNITSVWGKLCSRARQTPFNLVATVIFLLAIIHTFLAGPISRLAHRMQVRHEDRIKREGRTAEAKRKHYDNAKDDVSVPAQIMHLMGEVEVIFGLWLVPLMFAVVFFYGFDDFAGFVDGKVDYKEAMFVVVIMTMAYTRPIIRLAERGLRFVANTLGNNSPAAWWMAILIIGPVLGSFITEPAAMTISAVLLSRMIYRFNPSTKLKYATLGLLFVNVSVGGTLTHFAAPPVLMVASQWGWGMKFMFFNYGWKALVGIVISTSLYYFAFRKEFDQLKGKVHKISNYGRPDGEEPVPNWVIICVLCFIGWTVVTVHHPPLFIGGFLFFLAFFMATNTWQGKLDIRNPMLVGFFLAALVTHGKLQQWWIEPVLSSLNSVTLFLGSTCLTAFNDNAAITFLASQVPEFATNPALQHAVVYGAVTGGGLTVIANAPNPAGQSILHEFFGTGGISPSKLLLSAIVPTIIVGCCFNLLPSLCH